MKRLLYSCLVVGATLALASCGAINIVYNNAPTFVASEVDDAFDLNDEQSVQVDTALESFFDWHRKQELAHYQQMLNDAALAIADGITAAEYLVIYAAVRSAGQRSAQRMIDEVHGLTATLSPAQIDRYDLYFRERSEKYQDYLEMSSQQRQIFSEERIIDQLEEWFGELENLQYEKIAERLRQLPEVRVAWIGFREARHQAFIDALRKASGRGLSQQQLQHILLDPDSDYARAYEPQRIAYRQAFAQMLADVSGWLNKVQIRHAVERMREYEKIVIELQDND